MSYAPLPPPPRLRVMAQGDLTYFDQFIQDLKALALEYKAHLTGDPRRQAEQQYAEDSMEKWLAKNTKQGGPE